ncbi:MAG: hypothetical protein F6K14_08335 [Symploca sp. SIO2C1]|nr:hypothetical protein [Symploca sp. SIO2C1]
MTESGSEANRYLNTPSITSSHAATDDEKCYEMETKYGWKLLRIEPLDDPTFEVNCIFESETEFPNYLED